MNALTIKDIAIIATPFLLFALGVVVAAVGFLLRGLIADLKTSTAAAVVKAEKIDRDLQDFKALLPRQFVMKDDYIRTISGFEFKLDGMDKKIDRLIRGNDGSQP